MSDDEIGEAIRRADPLRGAPMPPLDLTPAQMRERADARTAPELALHIRDSEHYYNGSEGDWAVCGIAWPQSRQGVWPDLPFCPVCTDLWVPPGQRRARRWWWR